MISSLPKRTVTAALLLLTAACAGDPLATQQVVPPSAEPLDLSLLNGKMIAVSSLASGDFSTEPPQGTERFRVVGKTFVWGGGWQKSFCVLNGRPYGEQLAVLFTADQPRSNAKVPCEALSRSDSGGTITTSPSDVVYSSTMSVQGNVLELSAEVQEHAFRDFVTSHFTVKEDVTERMHAKFRLSASQCQVLEWSWATEVHSLHSSVGRIVIDHRNVKATGCSLMAVPK